jgi:transcriptional regulator with XRE-family HTH domain
MTGRRKWSEIRAKAAPETLAAAAVKTEQMLTSYRLRELREARGLTQTEMADRLAIRQVSVSKLEARADVRVSTLRSVLEAMGAELEIRARFPDAEYLVAFGDDDGALSLAGD